MDLNIVGNNRAICGHCLGAIRRFTDSVFSLFRHPSTRGGISWHDRLFDLRWNSREIWELACVSALAVRLQRESKVAA